LTVLCTLTYVTTSAQSHNRVNSVIDSIKKSYAPDSRVAIFKLNAVSQSDGKITLKGETNLPEAKKALLADLRSLSIGVNDSVKSLPETSLGDKTYGIATLSVADIRKGAGHPNELISQALMGTPLRVLKQDDGWYLVQTPDHYLGWMEETGLILINRQDYEKWKRSSRFIFTKMNGVLYEKNDPQSAIVSDLTLGDIFQIIAKKGPYLQVKLPDGRSGFVKSDFCVNYDQWKKIKTDSSKLIKTALKFNGLPYLWGGLSAKATDCSGFVKTVYFINGILLDRDASQQALNGQILPTNVSILQPGDLLFFGRKNHITHVGMYIGEGKYIHASGRVRINSLLPSSPIYNLSIRKSFVTASRILSKIGTKGISRVEAHSWYNSTEHSSETPNNN
jgi:uncharacterized protein YgiM (DUF1202 family)